MAGSRDRVARFAARAGALLVVVASSVLVVVPAAGASEINCADTSFASSGFELFELEQRFVPPPLRGFEYDCASRLVDVGDRGGDAAQSQYALLFGEASVADFVAIMRSFEVAGWIDEASISYTDGEGVRGEGPVGAEALAAVGDLQWATSRFSDARTGDHIISITYTDGVTTNNDQTLSGPSILVTASILGPLIGGNGILAPSVFSALRTISQVAPDAVQATVIAGSAIVLMLAVGWPSSLLNSVVGSRYQGVLAWLLAKFRRRTPDAAKAKPSGSRLPGWLIWPGFALAALIGAFSDPEFGVNPMSLRVVLTLLASFVLFNLATWAIVRRVTERIQPDSGPYLRFRWGTLFILALAVLIARLLELQPGIVFGLVAGIAFAVTLRRSASAATVIAGSGFALVLGAVGWVGYSLLAPVTAAHPDSILLVVGAEFLAAVTVKGVSTLPLSLLPLGGLDGSKLFKWKGWVWALCYAVGMAAFLVVMVSIPKAWGEVPGDFVRWTLVFGVYALLAVAVWAVNAWLLAKRPPKHVPVGEQPDAITVD